MTTAELRRRLGLRCRTTITRYLNGSRIPNPFTLQKIVEITNGQVQLRDFLSPGNPQCAKVEVLPSGRLRLVFPWTYPVDDEPDDDGPESANDNDPSLPVQKAAAILGDRVRQGGPKQWELDGRPADLRRIVSAANKILRRQRLPMIPYPGLKAGK
ncbi:MAG: hypothetical protein ACKVS8_10900 [Phycisphaerales bacterium]